MSVIKLNKPLNLGTDGNGVYPLTTADQIIKTDGSRLESNAGINSDTFNNKNENELYDSFVLKMYPIGSTYITSTNSNPASYLGGTWELIDKGFKDTYMSNISSYITLNANCSAVTATAHLIDHQVTLSISFTPTVALTDTTLQMFTIDLTKIGVTRLTANYISTNFTDGGQTVVVTVLNTAGLLTTNDVFVRNTDSPNSLAVGYTVGMSTQVIPVLSSYMIDSFCDKFYWKRTA